MAIIRKLSNEDQKFILDHYGKLSLQEIANKLSRKRSAIGYYAKKLGLKNKPTLYIGMKCGYLTILENTFEIKNHVYLWRCVCDCGNEVKIRTTSLKSGATQSCGCKRQKYQYTGTQHICGSLLGNIKRQAKVRKLDYNITDEFLDNLLIAQNFKCALSGLIIYAISKENTTASLDRIDSNQGYIESNVQWVHKDVNWMKQAYDQDYYIEICKLVAQHKGTL